MFGAQLILALLLWSPIQAQSTQQSDAWEPLKYFVGSWEGVAKGQPGNGKVGREYQFVLNGKYLQAKNKSTYPPQEKNPKGEVHEDWGLFSYDRGRKQFILRQFQVEGFVRASSISTRWTGRRATIRRSSSSPRASRTFPPAGAQERAIES